MSRQIHVLTNHQYCYDHYYLRIPVLHTYVNTYEISEFIGALPPSLNISVPTEAEFEDGIT